jgi:hypothetical protein
MKGAIGQLLLTCGAMIFISSPSLADAAPQPGIEPLHFTGVKFSISGPTWTEQVVRVTSVADNQ